MPSLRASILGFEVRIDLSFFLVSGLLAWGRSAELLFVWMGIVLVSILVHELGHAVAFRTFGHRPRILLYALGGLTFGSSEPPLTRRQHVIVSLAGPLTGLLLLGMPALLLRGPLLDLGGIRSWTTWTALQDLVWVNVGWSVVNLLPMLPLDGGHVASEMLEGWRGEAGWRWARLLSAGTAVALCVWAFSTGFPLLAIWGLFFLGQSVNELTERRASPVRERIRRGHRALDDRDTREAATIGETGFAEGRSRALRWEALELLAWSRLAEGRVAEARESLERMKGAEAAGFLAAALELAEGSRRSGIERAVRAFLKDGAPPNLAFVRSLSRADVQEIADRFLAHDGRRVAPAGHVLATHLHQLGRREEAVRVRERLLADGRPSRDRRDP